MSKLQKGIKMKPYLVVLVLLSACGGSLPTESDATATTITIAVNPDAQTCSLRSEGDAPGPAQSAFCVRDTNSALVQSDYEAWHNGGNPGFTIIGWAIAAYQAHATAGTWPASWSPQTVAAFECCQ
jgi:hypothetical protein